METDMKIIYITLRQFTNLPPTYEYNILTQKNELFIYRWIEDASVVHMIDAFRSLSMRPILPLNQLLAELEEPIALLRLHAINPGTPRTLFYLAFSSYTASATAVCPISLLLRTYIRLRRLNERKRQRGEEDVIEEIPSLQCL